MPIIGRGRGHASASCYWLAVVGLLLLKRPFDRQDAALEDLKLARIKGQRLAVDEAGEV